MAKKPDERETLLRAALAPLAAAGVTGDQARTMFWISSRCSRQGSSIDHRLEDILAETFRDNPPTRPCNAVDITFGHKEEDDALYLYCAHCDAEDFVGFNLSLEELTNSQNAHVARALEEWNPR